MDVSDASYYISIEKKKIKEAKWGTPKNIFKKTYLKLIYPTLANLTSNESPRSIW
jgi:hypothetical protein